MRWAIALGFMMLTACATDPMDRLEAETPTFSAAQVAALQKNTVKLTPETRGELRLPAAITRPLIRVDSERPKEPGGRYRTPIVSGTVNGRSGVRLLLDSGSNQNLLGYRLAHGLAIPIVVNIKPVTAMGIGGAVDNYPALVPSLAVGSLEFRNLPAVIAPDTESLRIKRGWVGNAPIMIVSVSAFRRLSYLTIDALRGVVTIAPDAPYLPSDQSAFVTDVPLRWEGDLPVVDISVDRRGAFPCIVDTGGDYGLLLSRKQASEFGYWKPGRGALAASRGVGGATLNTAFIVREAKLGGATLQSVPGRTLLIGPEPGGGKLLLGNVVLRQYRVTFDFRRNRLWLER